MRGALLALLLAPAAGAQMGEIRMAPILAPEPAAGGSSGTAALFAIPPETRARLLEEARRLSAELRFQYSPYDPASGVARERYWRFSSSWGESDVWLNRQSVRVPAYRAPGGGLLAARLQGHDLANLENFVAIDADGTERRARLHSVAPGTHSVVFFEVSGLPPVAEPDRRPFERGWTAELSLNDPEPRVQFGHWTSTRSTWERPPFRRGTTEETIRRAPTPSWRAPEFKLVFDSSAAWRGWLSGQDWGSETFHDLARERAGAVRWGDWIKRRADLADATRRRLAVVRLRFRPDSSEENRFAYGEAAVEKNLKSRVDAGLPLAPGRVFVPVTLSNALIQRLESVEVAIGGRTAPARFVGVLRRRYAGYLLETDAAREGLGGGVEPGDGVEISAAEPLLSGDTLRVRVAPEAFDGWVRGYKDALRRKTRHSWPAGTLLLDPAGRPFAALVEESRDENVVDGESWHRPSPLVHPRPLAELARELAEPGALVDAAVRPRSALETKRKPWLGVETQDINADLARLLGVVEPTRDGSLGQLVNAVIARSPAERAGLRVGDVLLRLREIDKSDEILLTPKTGFDFNSDAGILAYFRKTKTGLDAALEKLAPGRRVVVAYARGGREATAEAVLEESPPDIETAPKASDKPLGLTVKEITEDARRLLKLKDGFKGLLIYEVDSGSPAAIAGFPAMGLITELAGKPVSRLDEFTAILAAERAAKRETVRVRAAFFGRSRLAELRLSGAGPGSAP